MLVRAADEGSVRLGPQYFAQGCGYLPLIFRVWGSRVWIFRSFRVQLDQSFGVVEAQQLRGIP